MRVRNHPFLIPILFFNPVHPIPKTDTVYGVEATFDFKLGIKLFFDSQQLPVGVHIPYLSICREAGYLVTIMPFVFFTDSKFLVHSFAPFDDENVVLVYAQLIDCLVLATSHGSAYVHYVQ